MKTIFNFKIEVLDEITEEQERNIEKMYNSFEKRVFNYGDKIGIAIMGTDRMGMIKKKNKLTINPSLMPISF